MSGADHQQLAEGALREQAALLDNAQRIGGVGSWRLDLRSGRLDWPEATCHLFGITPAEFTGTLEQLRGLIIPEDRAAFDAVRNGVSVATPLFESEYRIRRPDGAVRWIFSRGRLEVDAAGVPIGRVGMVMDITEQKATHEQLEENAALLRIAGRVARLGGWTIQLPERTLTWSDENCAIHDVPPGYRPTLEEGLGYYPPEYRAEVMRHVEDCARDGTPYDFELPKITATGRRIWVRSIGEALRDADGRIVRLQGAFQDISDRRQAEEALRESEAEFRTLAESMPQMVWIARPDGSCTYINRRWTEYTGLSLEETIGYGWKKPFHPDDQERVWLVWQQASQSGVEYSLECRLSGADGGYRWMLLRGLPLRDRTGQITRWLGTATDIDALKQAQELAQHAERVQRGLAAELETERARLVAAQAVARVGSWETDLATQVVIWSAETYRIFETTPDRFQPTHHGFLQFIHPQDLAVVEEAFVHSLGSPLPAAIEHRLLLPNGRIKFVEERWQIVRDVQGRPVRATGTCQDITERKQLEQQYLRARRMESIGTLAGGIAHDLNNVFTPILLSTSLLQEGERDEARLETLATIESSTKRGAEMISQVLSFARGMDTPRVEVQLGPLVDDLVQIVRKTFPANISLDERVSADLWRVQADPTQIHQVLINLCANARDAMPGGGRLTIRASNMLIDADAAALNIDALVGPYVKIDVEDTGTGIAREIIDKIFDPFFTTKDIGKGTGLGLATSLSIVKGHAGFIRAYSEPGAGTRFCLCLPAQTTVLERVAAPPPVARPRGHGETVLVVDDEALIRRLVQRTLEAGGYRVLLAADGSEAVAIYRQHQSDIAVVLTDMMMPVMDGPATIQALVQLNPHVRIIGASGLAGDDQVVEVAGLSYDLVSKPYAAVTMLKAIQAALADTHP